MNVSSVTAIVLAGDRPNDPLSRAFGGTRKALIEVGGQTMLVCVLRTLVQCPRIGDVIVCANDIGPICAHPGVNAFLRMMPGKVRFLEGAASPAASVEKILAELRLDGPILVTAADNVLMSPAALAQFFEKIERGARCDVVVALARETDIRAAFPGVKRTYIRLGGYGYSGCNMFALSGSKALPAARFWAGVESERKRPWRLISRFGRWTLLKAITGRLGLDEAMNVAGKVIGVTVAAAVLDDPLAAMDVDRFEHWALAQKIFQYSVKTSPLEPLQNPPAPASAQI